MALKDSTIDEKSVILEESACALCGGSDSEPFLTSCGTRQGCGREYRLVRCRGCGLVFLNPRPTRESMRYYYLESDPEKAQRPPAFYERFYFNVFRRIPLRRKGRLLDVGCGSGRYIYMLKNKGWATSGIDIAYTDYGKKELGLDIYEGDLSDAGIAPESFDAVTLWWTLEHMYEPFRALKEAYRVLKPGGIVVVGVPNIDSLEARIFGKYWFHLFLPKHLYHFSPASLTGMLNRAGFGRVRIRHDPFSFGAIGSLECLLKEKGMAVSFKNPLCYALSLPFDMMLGLIKSGGLITAYAFK